MTLELRCVSGFRPLMLRTAWYTLAYLMATCTRLALQRGPRSGARDRCRFKDGNKLKKILKIVTFGMLGLVLMGSSVSLCTNQESANDLMGVAIEYSVPLWSKDGLQIIFSHPPSGVFVVQADGSRMWSLPPNSSMGTQISPGNFSPALSPDGSRVAYAMVVKPEYTSEIVTSALDGSHLRKLTSKRALDAYPAWSPDGTQIAFYSNREVRSAYGFHLYIMDSDGSDERSLVSSLLISAKQPPVWSPDGTRIAFLALQSEPRRYIVHTGRPDGSGLTELGDAASSPAWSPDGTRIAFIREGDETRGLYTMDPNGGNERLLWSFEKDAGLWYNNLSWSPDGSEILYGFADVDSYGLVEVVVVRVDGSGPRTLAEPRSSWLEGGAAWSPDGSRIAFHVVSNDSDVVLHTMARDGSDARALVRGHHERLVAEHSDWRNVSGDIAACSGGYVVLKPGKNPGLVRDCEALLRVRDALAGDAVLNWSAAVKISEWRGVGIEGSPPRVTRLSLSSLSPTKLTGIIPPELSDLPDLEVLSLHSNQLSGSIPPELGNLANLRVMRLSLNRLEGTVPAELGRLTSLETLKLSDNGLVGGIPPELGNLPNLKELWLRNNRLTGTVPLELGNLVSLAVLEIGNNDLTGCVPAELSGRLRSLGTDGLEYC